MGPPLIDGLLRKTLKMLVLDGAPYEVGGLIVDGEHVHLLHNYALPDVDRFEFRRDELMEALRSFKVLHADGLLDRVVLWHSHPAGGVGPSRVDMQQRTPFEHHLVVALVDGDIVPTWY